MLGATAAMELAREVVQRCRDLATITDVSGETTRTFLSPAMRRANDRVAQWMRVAGMSTRMDAAGNVRGTLPGRAGAQGRVVIGSHLDTVPNAGAFDGPLGVLLGVALAQTAGAGTLPFALEMIGFSEEEGVRFGLPFLGSRAVVGTLDAGALAARDADGISVRDAMYAYGLPADLDSARLTDAQGYLEFHIEQGPELDSEDLPVGVVETVAGQTRMQLTLHGKANHAGTTPMRLRHDALAAAAAFITRVEAYARKTRGVVATVGSMHVQPNAGNVIAGEVHVSLDVRSALDTTREEAVTTLLQNAQQIATERGLKVTVEPKLAQAAVPLDRTLLRVLEDSVDANGFLIRRMTSGAGHDAMIVAPHLPAAMLFLRSPEGISHHPRESVRVEDVAAALRIGHTFLQTLPTPVTDMNA